MRACARDRFHTHLDHDVGTLVLRHFLLVMVEEISSLAQPQAQVATNTISGVHRHYRMFGPLGLSFAPFVRSSRTLSKWIKPFAMKYADLMGYRKMGLKYDDLRADVFLFRNTLCSFTGIIVVEERPDVQRVRVTLGMVRLRDLCSFSDSGSPTSYSCRLL